MKSCQLLVALALTFAYATAEGEFFIESPHETSWGEWGPAEFCPSGEAVYGGRIKSEAKQGLFTDDTSLNAIQLMCYPVGQKRNVPANAGRSDMEIASKVLTSTEGHLGSWRSTLSCMDGQWVNGFQLRSEKDQSFAADDSAANNIKLFCSGGAALEGQGNSFGDWTEPQACPRGQYVCGLQTQVEKPGATDETSLNNVRMFCCAV